MRRVTTPINLIRSGTRELSKKFLETHVPKSLSDKEVNTQADRALRANPTKETNTSLGPRHNVEKQEQIFKEQVQQGKLKPDPKGQYKFNLDPAYLVRKREADMNTRTMGKPQTIKGVSVGVDPKGDWHHLGDTFKKGGRPKISSLKKKTTTRKK